LEFLKKMSYNYPIFNAIHILHLWYFQLISPFVASQLSVVVCTLEKALCIPPAPSISPSLHMQSNRMAQENGSSPAYFAQFAGAGTKHSKAVHLLEKSVINMI
jgi:hypothetical protein